ncbi:Arylsulfatase [Thalassoglobus neptunius]|uniref:Arylsulfatase n=2 Tax=Thalassoglobus neptunius TaxID=1938619 RepID=A0A5C5VR92_9PLAN|nr:Arylsulfatase [Thalassoglobus neptunius]
MRIFHGAFWLTFACLFVRVSGAEDRPDVVFIMIDDLRPMLGCYGSQHVKTPNIDHLASRGVVFDRAYCQYAKCGPSRLSLMTGLRPDSTRVYGHSEKDLNRFRTRRPEAVSMARWFKQHGYRTLSFGKTDHDRWQLAADWSEKPSPGRDKEILELVDADNPSGPTIIADRLNCPFFQSPDVSDDKLFAGRMTKLAVEALRQRSRDTPQFLAIGYRRPHLPLVAPKRYFSLYKPDRSWLATNPRPAKGSPIVAWLNSVAYAKSAGRLGYAMPTDPSRSEAMMWSGYELRSYVGVPNVGKIPEAIQLQVLQAYAACVSYVDAQVGKLIAAIEATGGLDNTIVVLCSDHGWHLGEQSAWAKMTNFEVATRVPLIVSAPGIKPARSSMLTELVDLYPTICELSGIAAPNHLEGESFAAELTGKGAEQQFALSQISRHGKRYIGRAIRTDRFRYIEWTETASGRIFERELYDHRADPNETFNVANNPQYADRTQGLKKLLRRSYGIATGDNQ